MCPELGSKQELTQSSNPGIEVPTTSGAIRKAGFSRPTASKLAKITEAQVQTEQLHFRRRMAVIIIEDLMDRGVHHPTAAQVEEVWENYNANALFWQEFESQPSDFGTGAVPRRDEIQGRFLTNTSIASMIFFLARLRRLREILSSQNLSEYLAKASKIKGMTAQVFKICSTPAAKSKFFQHVGPAIEAITSGVSNLVVASASGDDPKLELTCKWAHQK